MSLTSSAAIRPLLAGLTSLALLAAACTPPAQTPAKPAASPATTTGGATTAAAPKKGGTLRMSTLGAPSKVFTPYPEPQNNLSTRTDVEQLIWAYLIDIDYSKLEWVADPRRSMAKEMPRLSNNGRTFTFALRDDIKWSDGKPITTDDFVFTWTNASKTENNWVGLANAARIESLKAVDPKTLEVTLKEALAKDVAYATIHAATIALPKHVWEGKPWGDPTGNPEVAKPTVVSGPFVPTTFAADRLSFKRNDNWWGAGPNLDGVEFITANPQTITELLKTSQVEWAQSVPPASYADIKAAPNVNAHAWSAVSSSFRYIQFNLNRPLLKDKAVREALSRTLKRDDFIQFEDGLAEAQVGLYPSPSKWANNNIEKYDLDLNKAKQLLQTAGYTLQGTTLRDPAGQPVKLEILWPTTSAPRGKAATYMQQQWRQLGIDVQVTGLEFNAFVDRFQRQKDFDVLVNSSTGEMDADGSKELVITNGQQNPGGYTNPRVDTLIQQGAVEQDDAKRKAIYDEMQKILADDLPFYVTVTVQSPTAFDKKVGGVQPLKGGDVLRQGNRQIIDWFLN
jgi:peptide/nickel transport system substrate-binding protein